MAVPKINPTVLAVRESWERIAARRAQKRAPGGGRAEPMSNPRRVAAYKAQTPRMTPAQWKRLVCKRNAAVARDTRSALRILNS
jgi:hypothetical protein